LKTTQEKSTFGKGVKPLGPDSNWSWK